MAKVTINDVVVEVAEGTSVIAAADKAGLFVPRFCYHPDLKPVGNCRICQVEIEGMPKLVVSCMTEIKDGMVIRTDTPKVEKAVKGDLEFLLLNHPVDCPICDQAGECYLQDYYMAVGQHDSRIPLSDKVLKRKVQDLGPMIMLDTERCVMCSRCIRFSDDVTGTSQFGFFQRGAKMEIGTFRDRPLQDPYSGCYADVCPVGALTSKDFRFNSRVWFLKRTESVCPHCSTGCNIRIDHKDDQAYRFVPRRNPDVNASWMCDIGRVAYKELNPSNRLLAPQLRRNGALEKVAWDQAIAAIAEAVTAAAQAGEAAFAVVGLATPSATCEELWAFKQLMSRVVGTPHLDFRVTATWERAAEREDQVLRRVDHHPNTRGGELLGVVPGPNGMTVRESLERAAAGKVAVLYLLGPTLFDAFDDRELVARALDGAGCVVLHDTIPRPEHAKVDVLLPAATFAEIDGTFVNHAGRLQRIRRAYPPKGGARPTHEVVAELAEALTGEAMTSSPRELYQQFAAAVPGLERVAFDGIGPLGFQLDKSDGGIDAA